MADSQKQRVRLQKVVRRKGKSNKKYGGQSKNMRSGTVMSMMTGGSWGIPRVAHSVSCKAKHFNRKTHGFFLRKKHRKLSAA